MNGKDLIISNSNVPVVNAGTEIESARAIKQVEMRMTAAFKFNRNEADCFEKINAACQRFSLADNAIYSYLKGKKKVNGKWIPNLVEGATIRLIEAIVLNWRNIDSSMRQLSVSEDGKTAVWETCAWDMQNNVSDTKTFTVELEGETARDRYISASSFATKRKRTCLEAIIPAWVIEDAMKVCIKTIAKGKGSESFKTRLIKMVVRFSDEQVSKEMLEDFLGHSVEKMDEHKIFQMTNIYKEIKNGNAKRSDYFNAQNGESAINKMLKAEPKAETKPGPELENGTDLWTIEACLKAYKAAGMTKDELEHHCKANAKNFNTDDLSRLQAFHDEFVKAGNIPIKQILEVS